VLRTDHEKAQNLGREVAIHPLTAEYGPELVEMARETRADLIILPDSTAGRPDSEPQVEFVRRRAYCPVFVATPPAIPEEAVPD
jgi:hypothetical protein